MLSSEDKISIKTFGKSTRFCAQRLILTKIEKTNIELLSAKVGHNHFDGTHCREPSAMVVIKCRCRCRDLRHSEDEVENFIVFLRVLIPVSISI